MDLTFSALVTPAGVVIAAGLVTALVQLLRTAFPPLGTVLSGAAMAFILSALLFALTAVALTATGAIHDPDGFLNVFVSWLGTATSAVGIKSTYDHVTTP